MGACTPWSTARKSTSRELPCEKLLRYPTTPTKEVQCYLEGLVIPLSLVALEILSLYKKKATLLPLFPGNSLVGHDSKLGVVAGLGINYYVVCGLPSSPLKHESLSSREGRGKKCGYLYVSLVSNYLGWWNAVVSAFMWFMNLCPLHVVEFIRGGLIYISSSSQVVLVTLLHVAVYRASCFMWLYNYSATCINSTSHGCI